MAGVLFIFKCPCLHLYVTVLPFICEELHLMGHGCPVPLKKVKFLSHAINCVNQVRTIHNTVHICSTFDLISIRVIRTLKFPLNFSCLVIRTSLTHYRLDVLGTEFWCGYDFSALVQTSSGAHPASFTVGTRSHSGDKLAGPPTPI